jgi:hypothetical protein
MQKATPDICAFMAEKKYISLKEAAEISGYSSDYLGQLIRGGKLEGKQVFLNVAWMTTEEALMKYMKESKNGTSKEVSKTKKFKDQFFSPETLSNLYEMVTWVVVVVLVVFGLLLFYVFAVAVDHRLETNYVQKLQQN